jgi:DNA polymerase-3 subunit gamma/tau
MSSEPVSDHERPAPPPASAETSGEYVVVARRYRPTSFTELVGQRQVAQALTNAIATNRVGHAYLFTGARGVGKTSTARILAKCLNCVQGPTASPCGTCDACESIASGEDVDVLEIDGASNRGIEEIRQLRSNVNVRPSRSRFKIYIIDEVHMLTVPAFNALLKTLEEPPEHVKFVFCTTDPEKIPITVLSRCQRFDFAPVSIDEIAERLRFIVQQEQVDVEEAALKLLARRAAGSMRDSQSLLEQLLAFRGERITEADVHAMLGTAQGGRLQMLMEHLLARDAAAALAEVDQAVREGVDPGQLAEQLLGYFRDLMFAALGCDQDLLLVAAGIEPDQLAAAGKQWGLETLLATLQILDHALTRMRQSTQVRTLMEIAVVRICHLEQLDSIPELLSQIQSGAAAAPGGTPPARRAAGPATRQPTAEKKKAPVATEPSPAPPVPATPSASGGTPVSHIASAAEATTLWVRAMQEIGGMTGEFGGDYNRLAISAPNRLVVELNKAYNKEWCERGDVQRKIEDTLSELAGGRIQVKFEVGSTPAPEAAPKKSPASHAQRMRAIEQHPLVKEAIDLFDAEVVRFDERRRS